MLYAINWCERESNDRNIKISLYRCWYVIFCYSPRNMHGYAAFRLAKSSHFFTSHAKYISRVSCPTATYSWQYCYSSSGFLRVVSTFYSTNASASRPFNIWCRCLLVDALSSAECRIYNALYIGSYHFGLQKHVFTFLRMCSSALLLQ